MAWVGDLQAMRVLALALAVAAAVLLVILRRQAGALGAAQAGAAGARAEAQAAGLRAADATARLDGLIARMQRVLNVDGYEILTLSRSENRIGLNVVKLKRQFDLE